MSERELYRLLSETPLKTCDTETTGTDLHHSAMPFAATVAAHNGEALVSDYWVWDVCPHTRRVLVPNCDIQEVRHVLESHDGLWALQNAKFDVGFLQKLIPKFKWNWSRTHDTLYAGHLLNSSQQHDLTTMALIYLGLNIQPFEDRLKKAVKECRNLVRTKQWIEEHGEWLIAKAGNADMPSAKDETWKYDLWLPRAVAKELNYPPEHEYWHLLPDYMNTDSFATWMLFKKQVEIMHSKELLRIYAERIKLLPIVFSMEQHGLCVSEQRLDELYDQYTSETQSYSDLLRGIARGYDYDLKLPKSGSNKSLNEFCFGTPEKLDNDGNTLAYETKNLNLPVILRTVSGAPSLSKIALDAYQATLPPRSKQLLFVKTLRAKRKRDTALSYMDGYRRYWVGESGSPWKWLYPSLNPTGTITLRWSSHNPNEQNISKQGMTEDDQRNLRYAFGPAPGREWWSLDYDNLELRIPAYESGEPEMLKLFEHPEDPPYYGSYHMLVFDILHPELFAEHGMECKKLFKDTWYQWTKNGNFADQYGAMEETGTADRAFHVPGAQRKISERLTEKAKLNAKYIDFANKNGYVETLPDREVDPDHGYPIYCERTWGRIRPTVPLNYHVQGTACWVMMRAMIKVQEYFDELNSTRPTHLHCYIVLNVHDEIVIDLPHVPNGGNRVIAARVRAIMESMGECVGVRLTASMNYSPSNWSLSEDYDA